MSNRIEILEEYRRANSQLATLKRQESENVHSSSETVRIEPRYGDEMNDLTNKCAQLDMILEAMAASED
ncbi:MAG: hypothetical protein LKH74_02120 [Levilactobacillus sp.]|jgi:hypothetical protein|uniref:Uncharacterized protein n=1 Tax=Levilactobacillus suantsaiihabitans TaxID=2487722 RepID=A0A4Z0J889_9LACO|nr:MULTISPECIES: hypothetical protein [Levilactobacillus]MCH4123155.1 hypothetical protein [Levilactobacillus sp.]MCI1552707.1 hypothetical protein [Levilactobacillus sp.]MCI1598957.1 hypothetical protein [Levilactobacillus sp.]TGD17859.1 hypothetical protein EGT51_10760 [Levilactobacillus suantsaiihabitans]